MSLEGKTALITGGGSGIGRAIAIEASRRGIRLALAGRRLAKLEETKACLPPNAECRIICGDVTAAASRRTIRERVGAEWGRLDVLVNNAGMVAAGPLAEMRDLEIEQIMATNVVAPIALTRELLPLLRGTPPGRVVNLGSVFGDIGFPLFGVYSASKFALRGFSNALRRELRADGIGVTYVAPRGVRTEATDAIAGIVGRMKMRLDRPEAVARQIWDAVARQRKQVYPPSGERLFVLVEKLAPAIIDRVLQAQLKTGGFGTSHRSELFLSRDG